MGSLDGTHALLTGATGAIGAATLRGLVDAGARVVIGVRDPARGAALAATQRDPARVVVRPLDLASLASVRALARWAEAELPRLDLLINNAGVWSRQRRATADGFELTFGVNHLGHMALTVGLLPALRRARAARVLTVASGLHGRGRLAWDDLMQARGGFNGVRAYEQSKLANVMFAAALARRAGPTIASCALHPGVVRSGLLREYPDLVRQTPADLWVSPADGARTTLWLATAPRVASGRYHDRQREAPVGRAARVVEDQERLWRVSEALLAGVADRA